MNYGLPYKGSKNLLARRILDCIPSAYVFVDLFCGGCAVAHAALLSGRFGKVVVNDIEGDVSRLFVDAVNGRFGNETRWISRENFFRLKGTEPYVRYCWSFGNNGRDYLYSKAVEPYKRAVHYAVVFGDFAELRRLCPLVADDTEEAMDGLGSRKEKRIAIGKAIVASLKKRGVGMNEVEANPLYAQIKRSGHDNANLKSLERLERLQSLESLQGLQGLESLERLNLNYRDVPLPNDCVVYCDPPYAGTNRYGAKKDVFDDDAFWEWARSCKHPLFVSEYNAPEDFVLVAEFTHRSRLSATANNKVTERLFVHESRYDELKTRLI